MIKVIISVVLIACAIYGWRERRLSPMVGYLTPLLAALGVIITLRPDLATLAARLLGVGRGADLIFYLWTVLSVILIANIHFRLRLQRAMLTTLTRELALLRAQRSEAHDSSVEPR